MNVLSSNRNWMKATPNIDSLSLSKMCLPGTHNAGSDWKASYAFLPGAHFLACQHDSFYAQLNHGARALDLRLACLSSKKGIDRFRFCHDKYLSSRTLGDLFRDLKQFLGENPDEFVILDFHELSSSEGQFNYKEFNDLIKFFIGSLIIETGETHRSLATLKRDSISKRVLLTGPSHPDLDYNLFAPQIEHQWVGKGSFLTGTLKSYITEVMQQSHSQWRPWSLSAAVYTVPIGPVDIHDELNEWFDPRKSDWASKCNIINVDFIEESNIVAYCREANIAKALM